MAWQSFEQEVIQALGAILAKLVRLDQTQIQLADQGRAILETLGRIDQSQRISRQQERQIMAEIDDLKAQVEATNGIEASAVVAIHGLMDKISGMVQSATDLAALKAEVAATTQSIKDGSVPLAAAIAAPAPPAP